MRTITMLTLLLTLLIPMNGLAKEKKEKKKKEKKKYEWKMPEKLTKNADFDTFLLTCDTLYTRIQAYNESIVYYKVIQAETGETDETGQPMYQYAIVDDNGKVRNTLGAVSQYADFALSGTSITLNCANLTLLTISASTALLSLGLDALIYAKYLKAGPKIIEMGVAEIKEIVSSSKKQGKAISALKKSSTNTGDNKDVLMISSQIPEGVEIIQETKEGMDEKVMKAVGNEVGSADEIDLSVFD